VDVDRAVAWAIWAAGFGLSACAFTGWVAGLVACTAVTMALFTPWCAALGWVLRGTATKSGSVPGPAGPAGSNECPASPAAGGAS